jgi:3-oxoacyl-(acyl-carrier-protein) synthase
VTLLCLAESLVHPTAGEGGAEPALGVDLVVARARRLERCGAALSTNLAFGGANTALVITGSPR